MSNMDLLEYGSFYCTFCFDSSAEFQEYIGIPAEEYQVLPPEKRRESWDNFWSEYAEKFKKPCVKICLDYEETFICMDCLAKIVENLSKKSGKLAWLTRVET